MYAVVAYENGQNSFEHEYSISDNSSYDASFWQKVSTCVEQRYGTQYIYNIYIL